MSESELMETIGRNIKYQLEYAWMTQKELAEETGIPESTISVYATGKVMPSLKNLINIAYILNCDLTDLTDRITRIY